MKMRHSILGLLFSGLLALTASAVAAGKSTAQPVQELASGSALLVDLQTNQVLYSSNPDRVVPIASVTKVMTAMVTLDAQLPLEQMLPIVIGDVSEMRGVYSRVRLGSEISRQTILFLTPISSQNRAAARAS